MSVQHEDPQAVLDYVKSRCIKCGSVLLSNPQVALFKCGVCRTVNTNWPDSVVGKDEAVESPSLVEQCMHWSENQVGIFLRMLHIDANTTKILQDNQIDGPQLLDLTHSDIVQMGIKPEETVKALLSRIEVVRNS